MTVSVYGIDRAIWNHPDFADERFTQREAWLWLIGAAAYQDKRVRGPRGPVSLRRGEFVFSLRFLAEKWGWNKASVNRFIQALKNRNMIRNDERDNNIVYFINNYNKFQIVKAPKRNDDRNDAATDDETPAKRQRNDAADKEKDSKDIEDNKKKIARSADADAHEAVEVFNDVATALNWPKAQKLTKPRLSKLKARLEDACGIDGWRNAMARARASPFLRGDTRKNGTHEGWTPDLDFFLQQSSFTKLLEGKYDERSSPIREGQADAELARLQHDAERERERLGLSAPG